MDMERIMILAVFLISGVVFGFITRKLAVFEIVHERELPALGAFCLVTAIISFLCFIVFLVVFIVSPAEIEGNEIDAVFCFLGFVALIAGLCGFAKIISFIFDYREDYEYYSPKPVEKEIFYADKRIELLKGRLSKADSYCSESGEISAGERETIEDYKNRIRKELECAEEEKNELKEELSRRKRLWSERKEYRKLVRKISRIINR